MKVYLIKCLKQIIKQRLIRTSTPISGLPSTLTFTLAVILASRHFHVILIREVTKKVFLMLAATKGGGGKGMKALEKRTFFIAEKILKKKKKKKKNLTLP